MTALQSTLGRNRASSPGQARGFTLIEVMVVLAIIGILSAVAYPSYTSYIAKGYRADARATLLEAAQYMERQYAALGKYQSSLPARLQVSPAGSAVGKNRYTVTVAATDAAYTLSAEPLISDPCGSLTLTNTGVKGRTGADLTVAECWR